MNTGGELIQSLKEEIRKGIALIEHLDDEAYTAKPESPASVGSHFRHNLDFGTNLIRGLEKGELDYSKRDRDIEVETNRDYAIDRFNSLLLSLSAITESDLKKPITVRSEVDDSLWVESSLLRELEFIHSHTVHHYALI
ncbi:MAG: DinB family protein, partial [Pyrinomonadaceae bacterium]|nr:DinB family protein [Pyrinomonadaceae bacterium]